MLSRWALVLLCVVEMCVRNWCKRTKNEIGEIEQTRATLKEREGCRYFVSPAGGEEQKSRRNTKHGILFVNPVCVRGCGVLCCVPQRGKERERERKEKKGLECVPQRGRERREREKRAKGVCPPAGERREREREEREKGVRVCPPAGEREESEGEKMVCVCVVGFWCRTRVPTQTPP